MKKVLLSAAILASVPISSAFAENVAISVNANTAVFIFSQGDARFAPWGNVKVEYLGISNNVGVFGSGLFIPPLKLGNANVSGFGAEAGGRYYFTGTHSGPYIQGGVGFLKISLKDRSGTTVSTDIIFPSTLIGLKLGSKVFIDIGVGGRYYMGNLSVGNVKIAAFSGFSLALDLGLGIQF